MVQINILAKKLITAINNSIDMKGKIDFRNIDSETQELQYALRSKKLKKIV
jgi:hypothetical protein